MKLIGITSELTLPDESNVMTAALYAGVDTLHLRKPFATKEELSRIISKIPNHLHNRLVIHDHFALIERYDLAGLHLNSRSSTLPEGYRGSVSQSCHSLADLEQLPDRVSYAFLSPIYDSISKVGYGSHFSETQLKAASERGVIDKRVIALGGVTPERIPQLKEYGFGGVAMLGYLWQSEKIEDLQRRIEEIKELLCYNL